MQTKERTPIAARRDRETNEELIGVLTAISVVSKRLAGRLAAKERRWEDEAKGGKPYGTSQRSVRCCGRD